MNDRVSAYGGKIRASRAAELGVLDTAEGFEQKDDSSWQALDPADTPTDNTKSSPMPNYKPAAKFETDKSDPESKSDSDKSAESESKPRLTIELRPTSNNGQVAKVTFGENSEEFILSPAQFNTFVKLVGSWD